MSYPLRQKDLRRDRTAAPDDARLLAGRPAPGARAHRGGDHPAAGRPAPGHPAASSGPTRCASTSRPSTSTPRRYRQLAEKHTPRRRRSTAAPSAHEVLDIVADPRQDAEPGHRARAACSSAPSRRSARRARSGLQVGDRVATLVSLSLTPAARSPTASRAGTAAPSRCPPRARHPVRPQHRRDAARRPRPAPRAHGHGRVRRTCARRAGSWGSMPPAASRRPWPSSAGPASPARCRWPPPDRAGAGRTHRRRARRARARAARGERPRRRGRARRRPVAARASPAAVEAAGGPADVTVVCVDVPGCEQPAILATAQGGTIIFFSHGDELRGRGAGRRGPGRRRADARRQRLRARPRRDGAPTRA